MNLIKTIFSASTVFTLAGTLAIMSGSAMASSHGMQKKGGENCNQSDRNSDLGHKKNKGMRKGQRGEGPALRFAIIDENSDDRIGADEAAAWRESVFAAMDSDDDSELTMDEYMTIRMGKQDGKNPAKQAKRQDEKKARFAPMDSDNSDTVSLAEFLAAGKIRFEKADTDGDGIVTPWEFRANRRRN